jgi:sarcosine oxidase/L-pipecolate oxidase
MPPYPPDRVLIIGGGEFGLSAAAALAESSYRGCEYLITVLDPSATPPSMTAASSDLNKIVRSDYSDVMYSSLAKEALSEWRTVSQLS